jgi:hypothetical protein
VELYPTQAKGGLNWATIVTVESYKNINFLRFFSLSNLSLSRVDGGLGAGNYLATLSRTANSK